MYTCNNIHVDNLEMDQLPSLQSNINIFGFFPLIWWWYVDQAISQLNPTLYIYIYIYVNIKFDNWVEDLNSKCLYLKYQEVSTN